MDVEVESYHLEIGGQEFGLQLSHRWPPQPDVSPWCWRLRCPRCRQWYEIDLKILAGEAFFQCPTEGCKFYCEIDFKAAIG